VKIFAALLILSVVFTFVFANCATAPQYFDAEYDFSYVYTEEPELPEPEHEYERIAYLTFDDGPTAALTPQVLDILLEHNIRATFFVLPNSGVDHLFERIIAEGHALGNHSYTHDFSRLYANDGGVFFRNDTIRMHEFLYNNFGYETNLYRFPGGSMSWSRTAVDLRRSILEELGYVYFDWHVSSADTDTSPAGRDPNVLAGNILNNTGGREQLVVLMHDTWNQAVVEALPMIINGLREQGYGFDTLRNF